MYLIAALRETQPERDFVIWARKQKTQPPSNNYDSIPESPLYCRPSGYHTLHKAIAPSSRIYSLLSDARDLTNAFLAPSSTSQQTMQDIHTRILALQPGAELPFPSLPDRNTYEAIRLTTLLYSQSLCTRTPFSSLHHQQHPQQQQNGAPPPHIPIKTALQKTNTSDCWGHLAGILFWIALVAGASANPGLLDETDRVGEEEDGRKWLAAVAVRCSIVLSFEFGGAMLGTLERLVRVEGLLAGREEEWGGMGKVGMVVGGGQKGFADFAWEFEGAG